jgi:hypothetical protein
MDIRGYIRQARALPLDVTLRKGARLAARMARAQARLVADAISGSYGNAQARYNPAARVAVTAADIPQVLRQTLLILSERYLAHRFDVLGSGWVSPVYGLAVPGFLGHRYAPQGPAAPARDGSGLEYVVNGSNLSQARAIWRLIGQADYAPIDWQVDVRSGFRWDGRRPGLRLHIPVDRGADVKVPWELARLHHLPQLALCAMLASAGIEGFKSPQRYLDEIGDQIADFTATNPPRFGVNWIGTMDVAIRAANIAMTRALLVGSGLPLSSEIDALVARTLHDHGAHVAAHLEYSESGRSNHYLADLGGLVWCGWTLQGEEASRWLAFAVAELSAEADRQFLPDGGHYEGSTNYHRLSGEIVAFALALIGSLGPDDLRRLERATPPNPPWRAPFPQLPLPRVGSGEGGSALIAPDVLCKLDAAARLTRAVQGADNTIAQIGDTDSGRFFKLNPLLLEGEGEPTENGLDHRAFPELVDALLGRATGGTLDAVVAQRLLAGRTFSVSERAAVFADFGDVDALMARWNAVPETSRRMRRFALPQPATPSAWMRSAFPDFGLFVLRSGKDMVLFRCAGAPDRGAPSGHRHDDNLGIELRLGDRQQRDPGSFVYTPSIERRNAYRAAAAHDVPRPRGGVVAKMTTNLFELDEAGYARCLCWRPDAVAGELVWPGGSALRIITFTQDDVRVYDSVTPGPIADLPSPPPVARGYGLL